MHFCDMKFFLNVQRASEHKLRKHNGHGMFEEVQEDGQRTSPSCPLNPRSSPAFEFLPVRRLLWTKHTNPNSYCPLFFNRFVDNNIDIFISAMYFTAKLELLLFLLVSPPVTKSRAVAALLRLDDQ